MSPLVPAWLAVGWMAGAVVAYGTRLVAGSAWPEHPSRPGLLRFLANDPLLQGLTAVAFAALAWFRPMALELVVYSVYAAALTALLVVDWRTRYVYDVMVYPVAAAAVVLTPVARGGDLWSGAAGALIGAVVLGAFYAAGRLLYRGATPIGAGDVSLAVLMGAALGHDRVLHGILLGSLLGGALAVGFAVRHRSLKVYMPYGPALCLAALILLVLPA